MTEEKVRCFTISTAIIGGGVEASRSEHRGSRGQAAEDEDRSCKNFVLRPPQSGQDRINTLETAV